MNEQVSSALRTLLKLAGGALVTKGIVDSSGLEIIVSAVVTIIGVGWSWYEHRQAPASTQPQPKQ